MNRNRTPYIAVDLDSTLAEYTEWGDGSIGRPISRMIDRVKLWIAEGKKVKIFTARVGFDDSQAPMIRQWLKDNGLPDLEITATKDYDMIELWDDRCKQVIPNTGITIEEYITSRFVKDKRSRSSMSEEMITIKKCEYDYLVSREDWLQCLEAAGVAYWEGIEQAARISISIREKSSE